MTVRCCLFLLLLSVLPLCGQETEWQVVRHRNRDYVTLRSFCKFYGFQYQPLSPTSDTTLQGRLGRLTLRLNSNDAKINGIKYWLAFPPEEREGTVLISRSDVSLLFDPVLRPYGVSRRTFDTVVLDAGHGGDDHGARSRVGYEKKFTLDMVFRVKKLLESEGLRVVLTRRRDVFIGLDARVDIARSEGMDAIFVSLHFNQGPSQAEGIETFWLAPRGTPSTGSERVRISDYEGQRGNSTDPKNLLLASTVHKAVMKAVSTPDRGVKRARFWVLRYNGIPAILFEGGFLSNSRESRKIAREAYRDELAEGIVSGILAYRSIMERGEDPGAEIQTEGTLRKKPKPDPLSTNKPPAVTEPLPAPVKMAVPKPVLRPKTQTQTQAGTTNAPVDGTPPKGVVVPPSPTVPPPHVPVPAPITPVGVPVPEPVTPVSVPTSLTPATAPVPR